MDSDASAPNVPSANGIAQQHEALWRRFPGQLVILPFGARCLEALQVQGRGVCRFINPDAPSICEAAEVLYTSAPLISSRRQDVEIEGAVPRLGRQRSPLTQPY